jgi:hypothetical protein
MRLAGIGGCGGCERSCGWSQGPTGQDMPIGNRVGKPAIAFRLEEYLCQKIWLMKLLLLGIL